VSFKDIALPLVARGISVIPVQPGEKRCLLKDWPEQATVNESQIEFWNKQNHDYNVGCVGKLDSFAILDCAVKGLGRRIETETGQRFPETLVVRSAGKGTLHVYLNRPADCTPSDDRPLDAGQTGSQRSGGFPICAMPACTHRCRRKHL
jgi:hypothetical protein